MRRAVIYGVLFLFYTANNVLKAQMKDSSNYFVERNDFEGLARYAEQIEDKNEAFYYQVVALQQYEANKRAAKVDSILSFENFDTNSVWWQRAKATKLSYERKAGAYESVTEQGRSAYENLTDFEARFIAARAISISYRKINQYDSAMRWAVELEKLAETNRNDMHLHRALQNKANLHAELKEYAFGLEIERKLLGIATSLGKEELQILDMCNIGSSFTDLKQYDSARYYYNQALIYSERFNNSDYLALVHYNMASLMHEQGDYAAAATVLKKCIEEAEKHFQPDIISRAQYLLADCYFRSGNARLARQSLEEGYRFAEKYSLLQDKIYLLELDLKIKQGNGNLQVAVDILENLRVLEDSLLNEQRIKTIKEIEAKYENEKKGREIESLRNKAQIQALAIKQQRLLFVSVTAVLVLVVVLIYLFTRQRSLKKDIQLINTENRLLRSQMNPHFIFNAMSAIQRFIYQKKDPVETADYLGRFSRLTRMILDNSREELIRLKTEIEFIHNYVELQQIRFDEPFDFRLQVDPQLNENKIWLPPMIIQPFIENAVEHGLLKKSGHGKIHIDILQGENNTLRVEVKDNGVGKGKAEMGEKRGEHRSLAIKITRERLNILERKYKGTTSLKVDQIMNNGVVEGTIAEICLPIITEPA